MVAAAQSASITFIGLTTGKTYTKDVYMSDVVNALSNWDSGIGASAGSETFWTPPEPVALVDYAQVTGMTDTTKCRLIVNSIPSGDIFNYVIHVSTIANRPKLNVGIAAGAKIALIQLA